MLSFIVLLTGNFFLFIVALIGAQSCYFGRRWKWFARLILCVLISSTCLAFEVYQWLTPPESDELPTIVIRQPTTPL